MIRSKMQRPINDGLTIDGTEPGLDFDSRYRVKAKGGGGSTTVQQTELDPTQRKMLQSVLSKSESQYRQPLQYYPGQTLADVNPTQQAGQQGVINNSGSVDYLANQGGLSLNRALNADSASDPRVANAVAAAQAPIYDRLNESTLPSISSSAVQGGAFGGDRSAIQQTIATREADRAAGEVSANMYNQALTRDANTQLQAMGMLPQVQSSYYTAPQALMGVGQQQQQQQQNQIDDDRARFEFNQYEPEARLDRFASRVSGINLGGQSSAYTEQDGGGGLFGK